MQSGFRALHSNVTSLLNSTDNFRFNIDKGQINGVLFVDKLKRYGLNEPAIKYLSSHLNNRSQSCFINDYLSRKLPLKCGVPQGSILGPRPFLRFINNLPNCSNSGSVSMYAADTTVTFSAENIRNIEFQMNNELACLNNWLIKTTLLLTFK